MKKLAQLLKHHRFRLLIVMFVFLAIDLGMLVVVFEAGDLRANIHSIEDGVWWAVTTMTGVGYGDLYPVTTTGRLVGAGLQVLGLVIFALIVGYVAVEIFSFRDLYYWRRMDKRMDIIEGKIDRLTKKQEFLVKDSPKSRS